MVENGLPVRLPDSIHSLFMNNIIHQCSLRHCSILAPSEQDRNPVLTPVRACGPVQEMSSKPIITPYNNSTAEETPQAWAALDAVKEGFLEEVTLKLRTDGWVGVHHGSGSRDSHAEG